MEMAIRIDVSKVCAKFERGSKTLYFIRIAITCRIEFGRNIIRLNIATVTKVMIDLHSIKENDSVLVPNFALDCLMRNIFITIVKTKSAETISGNSNVSIFRV